MKISLAASGWSPPRKSHRWYLLVWYGGGNLLVYESTKIVIERERERERERDDMYYQVEEVMGNYFLTFEVHLKVLVSHLSFPSNPCRQMWILYQNHMHTLYYGRLWAFYLVDMFWRWSLCTDIYSINCTNTF